MITRIARHLTAANVLSVAALGVALAGSGYAVTAIPRNSVTTAQLAPGAVGPSDLAAGAVTSKALRNGSVRAVDLAPSLRAGAIRGPRGPRGVDGAPGARGPEGPPGPQGPPGPTLGWITRTVTTAPVALNAWGNVSASCLPGESAVGGGGGFVGANAYDIDGGTLIVSAPVTAGGDAPVDGETAVGWRVAGKNTDFGGQARELRVSVICGRA